jgi:hypothetical protein
MCVTFVLRGNHVLMLVYCAGMLFIFEDSLQEVFKVMRITDEELNPLQFINPAGQPSLGLKSSFVVFRDVVTSSAFSPVACLVMGKPFLFV